jgi:hypothetical protein
LGGRRKTYEVDSMSFMMTIGWTKRRDDHARYKTSDEGLFQVCRGSGKSSGIFESRDRE